MEIRASVSEQQRLMMQPTGKRRAESGKVFPVSQMVRLSHKPELVTEYVAGYVGAVADILAADGIQGPSDLDLSESFMHIVLSAGQNMTSGMDGLADGTKGVAANEIHDVVDRSAARHYSDGYKLGGAFSNALLKRGNFEALVPESEIPEELIDAKNVAISEWLKNKGVGNVSSHVVLHLHPYARLGFAHRVNFGVVGLDSYLQEIEHRHDSNPEIATMKDQNLNAVARGFEFADRLIANQEAIGKRMGG